MSSIKIHYLGVGVVDLPYAQNMEDAMWHLGAQYGAMLYNAAFQAGAIVFLPEKGMVKVNPEQIQALSSNLNL